ncbi:uncharacterized protein DS421_7g221310 [Arachis hypogaea]|nr:uncharacterized protein DS421_7g221310 [Arachis hypogaea]
MLASISTASFQLKPPIWVSYSSVNSKDFILKLNLELGLLFHRLCRPQQTNSATLFTASNSLFLFSSLALFSCSMFLFSSSYFLFYF